jgi:hypothetical protein
VAVSHGAIPSGMLPVKTVPKFMVLLIGVGVPSAGVGTIAESVKPAKTRKFFIRIPLALFASCQQTHSLIFFSDPLHASMGNAKASNGSSKYCTNATIHGSAYVMDPLPLLKF